MLVAHASETRRPFKPSRTARGGVVVVIALGGEEESTEFAAVQAATLGRVNLGSTDVLSRVCGEAAVDMSKAVETADRREAPVDGRRGQTAFLQPASVQLDVRSGRLKDLEADCGGPLVMGESANLSPRRLATQPAVRDGLSALFGDTSPNVLGEPSACGP
jgi:hypothetical protein